VKRGERFFPVEGLNKKFADQGEGATQRFDLAPMGGTGRRLGGAICRPRLPAAALLESVAPTESRIA